MKKSFAVLLICIGILNAQERSISGGGSRRNQFSAGKSQTIGFNCPEDFGYYPHPSDCGQYYVCVFGGALLESCTGGLMYSKELQTCDWPRNVVCNDINGPGISTVRVTDPRTSVRGGNQVFSATESLATSSLKRPDNAIRSREPVKSSGTSKSVFDESSRLRQGRFILGQESTNQNFNTGFQAQETSSRAFNVVAASPSPKFVFPPLLPGVSSTNRFAAPTAAPAVAPVRATPAVGQSSFYNDLLNLNDTDYYYYYDDILYDDYYEPTTKTTPKPRQPSRSRGNSPDLANSVNVAPTVSNKGRGSSSRPSSPSSPISSDSSFNSSPSSSFLGTFSSPPARTAAVRTGGETTSSVKQPKKSASKSSTSTRPSINQHSLSTPKSDSTSIDSSTTQRSSTALNFTVPSFSEHSSHLPSITNTSQLNSHSTPATTETPKTEQTTSASNITFLKISQEKFSVSAKQNIILKPQTLENHELKPLNKLKRKNLENSINLTASLPIPLQSFASSSFDTTGSGPFAPPEASPRIRIVENKNGFQNKPTPAFRNNQRLPFNLATVTFDLLRDRSRALKDSAIDTQTASNVNKTPLLLPLPLRPILNLAPLTVHPRLDYNEKVPVRSVTRKTTFLLPKSSNTSASSSHSPRLKGSVIPSHVRMVTSQPSPRPVSPSQRNSSAAETDIQNSSKLTRRISAPIPKRINHLAKSGSLNSSAVLRTSNGPNEQAKRISTSQTLFRQMLNSERDNIISQGKNLRNEDTTILSTTVRPQRTTFTFSTITTTKPSVFTPSSITTPPIPLASPKIMSGTNSPPTTRNNLRSTTTSVSITSAAETKRSTTSVTKSVPTSRPKSKQTFTTPAGRITDFTPKPKIIKNHPIKTTLKSTATSSTTSTLKASTTRPTKTSDNSKAATEAPREAFPDKSPVTFSDVNETHVSIPLHTSGLESQRAKPNSTISPVTASKAKVNSSNFATITVAQLRSRNFDQKSILHPISNLTHASLVTLKTAHKPSSTPTRPSIAPSPLNSFPLNKQTFKPEQFSKRVDNNESSLINSSQETGPDRGSSSQSSTKVSASGSPELIGKGPQRLVRPSKKPPPVSTRGSLITDIWKYPPRRPASVYPQPQVDTLAIPCDPTVCVLPDCYCGQSPVPGNIPPQNVPQMVLLTFDDSVNDLNKKLYVDLFEKGRVNPNGCPIAATYYVSHEWTDYSQVQNLYSDGHEIASHSVTHSFGEKFSTEKWAKEIGGQREIMSAYGGVRMEDIRGMRAPFLAIGGNNMFRMLYDLNFTYDSSIPVYENRPPSWPYTLDYKLFHDCMIPPCPTHSYPGVWQVPMVMWQDLTGGRCSMGDACTTPADAEGVYKFLIKNFERHYTTNRSPLGLYYHAAWFTTPHHKEGFVAFLDTITAMDDVWLVTSWQSLQWVRNPVPLSQAKSFKPFQCDYPERPPRCTAPKVCNVWHKGSVRYLKTCQQCPEFYPWVGNTGVQSPLNDVV